MASQQRRRGTVCRLEEEEGELRMEQSRGINIRGVLAAKRRREVCACVCWWGVTLGNISLLLLKDARLFYGKYNRVVIY